MAMTNKGQWMILEYWEAVHLPNLHLSPQGVAPQCDRQPCTIADYTFLGVNIETMLLAEHMLLQFGCTLHCLFQQIVQSNPDLGPVYIIKLDLANGFY